jgi:hypothetical protein
MVWSHVAPRQEMVQQEKEIGVMVEGTPDTIQNSSGS